MVYLGGRSFLTLPGYGSFLRFHFMTTMRYDVGYDRPNITTIRLFSWFAPTCGPYTYLPQRHSARGTPYHRYVLLLLRVEGPTANLSLPHRPLEQDASMYGMPVARLCGGLYGMRRAQGCGGTSPVSTFFASGMPARHLSKPLFRNTDPCYGYPLTPDPYCFEGGGI